MGISTQPIPVVSIADTALDVVGMGADAERWKDTRDATLVKLLPGVTPTIFHVGRIDANSFGHVQDGGSDYERKRRAFAYGVRRIDNFVDASGQVHASFMPRSRMMTPQGALEMFSDEQMADVSPLYIEDIGGVSWWRSFLGARNGVTYPLSLSCRLVWVERFYQAAATIDSAPRSPSSAEPPAEEQTA